MVNFWTKEDAVRGALFPQHPSFCAVAACGGAINALLGEPLFTQAALHEAYGVGGRTKLELPPGSLPADLASWPRSGAGMSNWDVVRLFNSALLDADSEPHTAILCGADFVRETANEVAIERLLGWARRPFNQVVIHLENHYVLLAGLLWRGLGTERHLLVADSASRKGPLRSLAWGEVRLLAERDARYGWVLLSDRPLPEELFSSWTAAMLPQEVTGRERFERTGQSR